jgi:glycerol-3-phosphate acyltransferase PlsY
LNHWLEALGSLDRGDKLMDTLSRMGVLALAYGLGSIPFGFLLVKLTHGIDVMEVASGRTGGTNTMRAAGFGLGFITSLLDILKSAIAVWIARYLFPTSFWFHVLVGLMAVIGHNYSVFLIKIGNEGKVEIGGGAGGTPAVGSLVGLWWPSILILVPAGYLIVMVIGYASLATMSLPLIGSLILLIRFLYFDQPWEYVFSGLLAEIIIIWALRPNIQRLLNGTERVVGFRAKKAQKKASDPKKD